MNAWRSHISTVGQLFVVTLLGSPLITPLLRWSDVPCTHDGHLHVHRVAALRHAWENGIYFSRWIPDLAFGYGYPFFVYREPGPLYAVLLPHLAGLPLPAASNLFYALAILASGWFMYLWVRDVVGVRAGLVSAVAYMAAPYVLVDALVRGNAPESMALPLFPFLLWMGRRWIIEGTALPFLLGSLGLALLSLSHNISTLIFAPSLLVYLLVIGRVNRLNWLPLLGRLTLLVGLGLGLAFFYTGGALLEMDQVTLSQSTVTRNNDFRYNFASLGEILAPVAMKDPNLLNAPLPIRLGWIPALLAAIGLTTPWWKRWITNEQQWHVYLMGLGAVLYLFMALPVSLVLWEGVPLIDFVQFPWRFVGRAALPVAFLAGMPFLANPAQQDRGRRIALDISAVIAITLLILEAMPGLYPRFCPEKPLPTIVDVHEYEAATGLVGIDPEGSYFPRTVQRRPQDSPLRVDYRRSEAPQRFDNTVLPAGATAEVAYDKLSATIEISSPSAFTARYLTFDFPGWVVTIDGEPVPITPSNPEGLITFQVPPGRHTIQIDWQRTPLRTWLMFASLLALGGIVLTLTAVESRTVFMADRASDRAQAGVGLLAIVAFVALALLAFKILWVDTDRTILRRPGDPAPVVTAALQAAELQFAGYSLSDDQVAGGETVDIALAWKSVAPTTKTYQSNIWLADEDGLLWSDKETQRPRLFEDGPATWEWEPGTWAWDSREVRVIPGTPPGSYDLVLTLFDRDTLQPVTLIDSNGAVVGPTAIIGQMTVTSPNEPPVFQPQYPVRVPLSEAGLALLGYNQDRSTAAPGEELLLTFFWERIGGDLAGDVSLELVDDQGRIAHDWQINLLNDSSTWAEGDRLRTQHLLRLPAGLRSAAYQFQLQDQIPLASLTITAPERILSAPPAQHQVYIPFGEEALLTGYSTRQEGDRLFVDLIWSAQQLIDQPYHVFVHLVDDLGELVAQADGEPATWSRPTTGWLPGEYIIDSHTLNVPAGLDLADLRLQVGLYDPASGRRLITGSRDTAVLPVSE